MIRIVLARTESEGWKLYRQSQWVGQVREHPGASGWERIHLDIEEDAYKSCLARWVAEALGQDRPSAEGALIEAGARIVAGPGRS